MTLLEAALSYIARGFRVVPIPVRSKGPVLKDWPALIIGAPDAPAWFNGGGGNIGAHMGKASGGLADADLDCQEAIAAAGFLLPKTATFGHASKRVSHYIYRSPGLAAQEDRAARKWTAPDGGGLLELRTGGGGLAAQTVFPPSVHPSGEPIEWDDGDKISDVAGRVFASCSRPSQAGRAPRRGCRSRWVSFKMRDQGSVHQADGRGDRRRQRSTERQDPRHGADMRRRRDAGQNRRVPQDGRDLRAGGRGKVHRVAWVCGAARGPDRRGDRAGPGWRWPKVQSPAVRGFHHFRE
jgi:hypothetical protein